MIKLNCYYLNIFNNLKLKSKIIIIYIDLVSLIIANIINVIFILVKITNIIGVAFMLIEITGVIAIIFMLIEPVFKVINEIIDGIIVETIVGIEAVKYRAVRVI